MGRWLSIYIVSQKKPSHCENSICFNINQSILKKSITNMLYNKAAVCKEINKNINPIISFFDKRISLISTNNTQKDTSNSLFCPFCISVINETFCSIEQYEINHSYSNPIWSSEFNIIYFCNKIIQKTDFTKQYGKNIFEINKKKFDYELKKLKEIQKQLSDTDFIYTDIVSYEESEAEYNHKHDQMKKIINNGDYDTEEDVFFDVMAFEETIKVCTYIENAFNKYEDILILFENEL
jgi:hypothetical protein